MIRVNGRPELQDDLDAVSSTADDTNLRIARFLGERIEIAAHIQAAAGPEVAVPILQVTGGVLIIDQWAVITAITALANCTNIRLDLWDGVLSTPLTRNPGPNLSGVAVGAAFTRGHVLTDPIDLLDAATGAAFEPQKKVGYPILVNQKFGADTFVRFIFTPGAEVDFEMNVTVEYSALDDGTLVAV